MDKEDKPMGYKILGYLFYGITLLIIIPLAIWSSFDILITTGGGPFERQVFWTTLYTFLSCCALIYIGLCDPRSRFRMTKIITIGVFILFILVKVFGWLWEMNI